MPYLKFQQILIHNIQLLMKRKVIIQMFVLLRQRVILLYKIRSWRKLLVLFLLLINLCNSFSGNLKVINLLLLSRTVTMMNKLITDPKSLNSKISIQNSSILSLTHYKVSNFINFVFSFVTDIIYLIKLVDILYQWHWSTRLMLK